jgi:hypothetical protein
MRRVRQTRRSRPIPSAGVDREVAELVRGEKRAHVLTSARLRPVQRSEIEHLVRRPVREQAEEIAQVRPRFDLAELGAREERGDARCIVVRNAIRRTDTYGLVLQDRPDEGDHGARRLRVRRRRACHDLRFVRRCGRRTRRGIRASVARLPDGAAPGAHVVGRGTVIGREAALPVSVARPHAACRLSLRGPQRSGPPNACS